MQYMGSKNRIAKHILPILLSGRKPHQIYVEPFVGGANMIDKVGGRRLGNDNHYNLIALWKALQQGWKPPTDVSKSYYYEVKSNRDRLDPALVGFVGFLCSFGGKWWGGYAANKKGDNYADRGARVLLKQIKCLTDVVFTFGEYWNVPLEPRSFIYCDPPYEGTTQYAGGFDHTRFWDWSRNTSKQGHDVLVSEYAAPEDFECIKSIEHKTILDKNSQYHREERLFRYRG